MRFSFLLAMVLGFLPSQAYACGGASISKFAIDLYFYAIAFSPAYILIFILKIFLSCYLTKKSLSGRMWASGFLPLVSGILLTTGFHHLYMRGPSEYSSLVIKSVLSIPVVAIMFSMSYHLEKRLFIDDTKPKENKKTIIVINLVATFLITLWIWILASSFQCSSQASISKINASSVQIDNLSVFE